MEWTGGESERGWSEGRGGGVGSEEGRGVGVRCGERVE